MSKKVNFELFLGIYVTLIIFLNIIIKPLAIKNLYLFGYKSQTLL